MPERNSSEGANKFELKSSFIILSLLSAFNKDLLSAYYVPAIMLGDVDAKEPTPVEGTMKGELQWKYNRYYGMAPDRSTSQWDR